MSTKLNNNIQKLNQQVKSLKGQLKAKNGNLSRSNAPVAYGNSWTGSDKPLRVRQSERIATIIASSTPGNYSVDSFAINPGNSTTFPWLASFARLFDRYKFHELKFKFVNYASTTTSGNVTMAIDFDTLDTAPTDSVGMSNMAKFVSFSPWKVETLTVPVNRRGTQQYLFTYDSNAESNVNVDLKTYNLGNFLVSTEGLPSNQVVGYIVAEYDVELFDKNNVYRDVILDNDFICYRYETTPGVLVDEHSGLECSVDTTNQVIKLTGFEVGETYNVMLLISGYPASANPNVLTGLTPTTGESYTSNTMVYGVCTATAATVTYTSSSTASSLTYSVLVTKI